MKRTLLTLFTVFAGLALTAQNFTGQWKGSFSDKSTSFVGWGGNRCDYVLELDCSGTSVSGYSYTYFSEGGKRYYTICRLKGTINTESKSLEIREVERTKTNVPNTIRNCFQVHRLSYFKQGDEESLEGSWVPAPKQDGDCGFGSTTLSRRMLQKSNTLFNNSTAIQEKPVAPNKAKQTAPAQAKANPRSNNLPTLNSGKTPVKDDSKTQVPKQVMANDVTKNDNQGPPVTNENPVLPALNLEKRNNTLIKTIEIANETFRVDLYDNGEIDGDSISLIFNGKLILAHKRLSDKALSLTLNIDDKKEVNELIMYAENLGSIPPNTALMVVTDGDSRYEVRIASDLEKSGSIRFIHKPRAGQ